MRIHLATGNQGKINEIEKYTGQLHELNIELTGLSDLPEAVRERYNPVETGAHFSENALIKARALYDLVHEPVLAEDSGLCVDALGGRPGVLSARYAETDDARNLKLLSELEGIEKHKRGAHYTAVICYIDEAGNASFFVGTVEGLITTSLQGEGGFGYDPLFYHEPSQATFARISTEEKSRYSHRGRALRKLTEYLKRWY